MAIRLSFKEFLGLLSGDPSPDARTIWLFQNNLIQKDLEELLFEQFNRHLDKLGLFVNAGQIIDASFVEVPRQRNRREENRQIKEGNGADLWKDNPCQKRQKDIDARWAKKNDETYYGYKDHVKIDSKSKLINTYEVTSAEVHDSQPTEDLLRATDWGQELYADSAYTGKPIDTALKEKGMIPKIIERAFKGTPLTEAQIESNHIKSKTRCSVEHIFGFVTNSMNDFYLQSIGFKRAKGVIGLINLAYNMCRFEQIVRLNLLPIRSC